MSNVESLGKIPVRPVQSHDLPWGVMDLCPGVSRVWTRQNINQSQPSLCLLNSHQNVEALSNLTCFIHFKLARVHRIGSQVRGSGNFSIKVLFGIAWRVKFYLVVDFWTNFMEHFGRDWVHTVTD